MKILSPAEITNAAANAGAAKAQLTASSTSRLLISATLAGAYIALGGILSMTLGFGFPEITAQNPALQRILSGAAFPIGLILVVVLGAELFTGNNAVLIPSMMQRRHGMGLTTAQLGSRLWRQPRRRATVHLLYGALLRTHSR